VPVLEADNDDLGRPGAPQAVEELLAVGVGHVRAGCDVACGDDQRLCRRRSGQCDLDLSDLDRAPGQGQVLQQEQDQGEEAERDDPEEY
jgi:hypothetical protein